MEAGDLCSFCMRPECPGGADACERRRNATFNDGRGHSGRFIVANGEHASSSDLCATGVLPCDEDCPMFHADRVSA